MKEEKIDEFFNVTGNFLGLEQKKIDGLKFIFKICFKDEIEVTPTEKSIPF